MENHINIKQNQENTLLIFKLSYTAQDTNHKEYYEKNSRQIAQNDHSLGQRANFGYIFSFFPELACQYRLNSL